METLLQVKQSKEFTPTAMAGRCSDPRTARLHKMEQCLEKTNSITPNILLILFLQLQMLTGDILEYSWGQLSWLCPLPCALPALAAGVRSRSSLALCQLCSAVTELCCLFRFLVFAAQLQTTAPYYLLWKK